jgi:hypothetical protein
MSGDVSGSPRRSGPEATEQTSPSARESLKKIRQHADEFVKDLLQSVFNSLDEEILALNDKIKDDSERNLYVEGSRTFQLEKAATTDAVLSSFAKRFSDSLRSTNRNDSTHPQGSAPGGGSLSLVNDTQLEESLAIDNLIARMHEHFADELFGLEQRLAHICPNANLTRHKLPIGPEPFCHAFQDAVSKLDVDIKMKLFIYKLIDRLINTDIEEFYINQNEFLVSRGILPNLKMTVKKSSGGGAQKPLQQSAHGKGQPAAKESHNADGSDFAPIHEQMFQAMQHLLMAHSEHSAGENDGGVPGAYMAVTPQLLDALSALQHDDTVLEQSEDLQGGGLKQHVMGHFNSTAESGQTHSISQIDDETIDVISMIFDYILDDRTLPDFTKALIGRLQIPVLKVAIVDREFFSRKSHPARQLLNELAYAGMGWNEESEATKDRLFQKMESIVMRILHEFQSDISLFEELLHELRSFLELERKDFAEAQEKIGEAAQEVEHTEKLRKKIGDDLANMLLNKDVPDDVRAFLLVTWLQVLTDIAIRSGADSDDTEQAFQVVNDLIWSIQPKASPEDRKKLVKLLPLLLTALRNGLRSIECGEEDIEKAIKMLETYHFASLKGDHEPPKGKQIKDSDRKVDEGLAAAAAQASKEASEIDRMLKELGGEIDNLPKIDDEDLYDLGGMKNRENSGGSGAFERMMAELGFEVDVDEGPRIEDEYTELVKNLELGTWVELQEDDGHKLRVKLAWKGDEYTNFSFMNRQFKVVAERPLYVLADAFRQGTAALIEDVALFDRAMDGVISGIMKFAK